MTARRKPLVRNVLGALVLLATQPVMSLASAADTSPPSQLEREFWASARQIDTAAAYQAYLKTFPNGFFAPLASAAIKKGDAPAAASAANSRPVEARGDARPDIAPFSPSKIAGPAKSSAITQQVGDVFYGPGPITVGWLGAKKQIVVPRGPWVLLAAQDSLSTHRQAMSLTMLVLAKLEGDTVRSFLVARFSSKQGNRTNTWNDAKACESAPPSAPFAWHEEGNGVMQCVKSALVSKANATKVFSTPIWTDALQALAAGGGAAPGGSYLLTDLFFTGDASNYLKVSRIDFGVSPGESAPVAPTTASLDLSLAAREKWARAYSALAATGYRKKLSEDELDANSAATMAAAALPD